MGYGKKRALSFAKKVIQTAPFNHIKKSQLIKKDIPSESLFLSSRAEFVKKEIIRRLVLYFGYRCVVCENIVKRNTFNKTGGHFYGMQWDNQPTQAAVFFGLLEKDYKKLGMWTPCVCQLCRRLSKVKWDNEFYGVSILAEYIKRISRK